jgi:hypothetical protein
MLGMKNEICTHDSDYTLDFGSGLNSNGCIQFTDRAANKESLIEIAVDDREFQCRVKQEFPSVVADLIDLAVAIHAADRLAFQNLRQAQTRIHIVLPVRHPEIMNTESFQSKLEDLLAGATGSRWLFDFPKRSDMERSVVEQASLPLASQGEVAMWSGGLDAFAGLYQRLRSYPEKSFVLFGTGANVNVHKLQEDTEKQIRAIFPGRCTLYRVPIRFCDSDAVRKNKITRARGVVFAMLGAACASLMGQQELCFIEDKTRYLILHGNYLPAKDPSESLRHMLAQVDTLRCLLDRSQSQEVQWEALTRKFPNLDDIVDRCYVVEKLTTLEMQSKLIRLYQNYVAEWDDVTSQLSVNLIKSRDSESLYRD